MRRVEVFTWLMPREPWEKSKSPYPSRWKMTAEEAAKRGAIEPIQASREIRRYDLTPEEQGPMRTSAFLNGKPPGE